MTYIPTMDEWAAAIAPLMKLSTKMIMPPILKGVSNGQITQDLVLMAVDAPEPFPKRVTALYERRAREFGTRLEKTLGPNWTVLTCGKDYHEFQAKAGSLLDATESFNSYVPDKVILLYDRQGDVIVPGTDNRSGSGISFHYLAAEFETPELKLAWQICQ